MRIAIIGAGISCLSCYLFLRKYGLAERHNITIYETREAADSSNTGEDNTETYNASAVGASISLGANGFRVLARLDKGLHEEVARTGHLIRICKISTARGWTLANIPAGPDGDETLMIGREDFWRCLTRRVPESALLRKKVVLLKIGETSSRLEFGDGSDAEADLVVGADGIWSVVRRAIVDAGAGKEEYKYSPHYEGLVGLGSFIPSSKLANVPDGEMNIVFGANGFYGYAYTNSGSDAGSKHGDKAFWWSTYSLKDCPADWRQIDKADALKSLQDRHSTWKDETVQNIIQDVEITSLYPTFTTPLLLTWERNGCVLVGDAAHALQPSSGQGGSMALEDCEGLALLLRHYVDEEKDSETGYLKATEQYCSLRMPRVGKVHKKAQEVVAMKQDMGFVQEMIMYFFIWVINRFRLSDTYNRWLFEYDGPGEVEKKIKEEEKST